jgi:hypothetical protein
VQISNLRKLLGGEVIATVPARGYRFVAVVGSTPRASAPASVPGPASEARRAAAHRLIGRDDDLGYEAGVEIVTPCFDSSGSGQINAIFPVTPLA